MLDGLTELPDFSVFATVVKTLNHAELVAEIHSATNAELHDVREYQDLIYLHWCADTFADAKALIDALDTIANRPELIFLQIMSRVHGSEYITLKNARRR